MKTAWCDHIEIFKVTMHVLVKEQILCFWYDNNWEEEELDYHMNALTKCSVSDKS